RRSDRTNTPAQRVLSAARRRRELCPAEADSRRCIPGGEGAAVQPVAGAKHQRRQGGVPQSGVSSSGGPAGQVGGIFVGPGLPLCRLVFPGAPGARAYVVAQLWRDASRTTRSTSFATTSGARPPSTLRTAASPYHWRIGPVSSRYALSRWRIVASRSSSRAINSAPSSSHRPSTRGGWESRL